MIPVIVGALTTIQKNQDKNMGLSGNLSSLTSGRSSRLHPMSVQSYCRKVLEDHQILALLYEGVDWRMLLMSLSLLLPSSTCLVYLIWMVLEMGSRRLYNCLLMGCSFQGLFSTHSFLVQFPSSFFFKCLVSIHVVHP